MDFPTIHTNFWMSVIAVPVVMILTQLIKKFFKIKKKFVPFNEKIILSNTSPTVPLAMTFGGMFSRGLGIDSIGIPLLVKGAKQCSEPIIQLVEKTKQKAKQKIEGNVIIIDNKNFQT